MHTNGISLVLGFLVALAALTGLNVYIGVEALWQVSTTVSVASSTAAPQQYPNKHSGLASLSIFIPAISSVSVHP